MAALVAALCCAAAQGSAGQQAPVKATHQEPFAVPEDADHRARRDREKPWHIDLGLRTSFPRLDWTEEMLDRRLDLPLKLDWLGVFDQPYTPVDRRTDLKLGSLYLGVGRQESDRWVWSVYGGGGAASDATNQRFLNTTLDVRFRYVFAYVGLLIEYYPWKMPPAGEVDGWSEFLRRGRPFVLTGLEAGYVSGSGKGDYRLSGQLLYRDAVHVRDCVLNVPVGLGWSAPLSRRWSVQVMGDYRFHFYRPDEYNGWHLVTQLRYQLGTR